MGLIGLIIRNLAVFALMARASRRKSLTPNGLVAGAITGLIHAIHPWSIYTILLFTFFITGTAFTKVKANIKKTLTASSTGGNGGEGPRNEVQVLANSLPASILIILHYFTMSNKCWNDSILVIGVFAQYAAVTADTWSSELGILSKTSPVLITTLRKCPPGTNGGVSKFGLGAAVGGGALIGIMASLFTPFCATWSFFAKLKLIVGMSLLGLIGSTLDSVIGALFQESVVNEQGKIIEVEGGKRAKLHGKVVSGSNVLSNNQVNLLMATLTPIIAIAAARCCFHF
ncbi:integral membrane protein DUF92-domain-containing protein [Lipomyces arxii]|uniref:integral membrane protein DUF92-domain-containing protein n=1 Tax=Lipomyces arxii TaxID=56418 RepID=UPI0034CFE588